MISSNEVITSYVFRYSYANLAKRLGYSKDIIAEALGHEYGNPVTGIYLEQFDMSVVDEMNEKLIKKVYNSFPKSEYLNYICFITYLILIKLKL